MQMMQESLANKYNKLLCLRHEKVIIQTLEGVLQFHQKGVLAGITFNSLGPSFQVNRKVETLFPLAIIDTQSS